MKLEELIGKKIKDIKTEIRDYAYDGSIALEESHSHIILETEEVFEIPFNNSEEVELELASPENLKSIFDDDIKKSFFDKIINYHSENQKLIKRNTENIKGKEIIAIFQYDKGFSKNNREWDKCLIEVESGFMISEKLISPKGTGSTGIWIFTSKEEVINKIGKGFRKIF